MVAASSSLFQRRCPNLRRSAVLEDATITRLKKASTVNQLSWKWLTYGMHINARAVVPLEEQKNGISSSFVESLLHLRNTQIDL